jgi:hypothetical protein
MSEPNEEPKCGICWEIIGEKKVHTPCNHTYCTSCFFRWMKENRNCPACRKGFDDKEIKNRREILQDINRRVSINISILNQLRETNRYLTRSNIRLVNQKNSLETLLERKCIELECLGLECRITRDSIEAALNYRREWEELYGREPNI